MARGQEQAAARTAFRIEPEQPAVVRQESMTTVPRFQIPSIPMLQQGLDSHDMFSDLPKYRRVRPDITHFPNRGGLEKRLQRDIVKPAEEWIVEIRRRKAGYSP